MSKLFTTKSGWYQLATAVFVACLICANVIAVKLIPFGPFILVGGMLVFPLSYIFGDILVECFGLEKAHRVIWLGFSGNLLFVVFAYITGRMPHPAFWTLQEAYDAILGFTPRLLIASFCGYMVGQFSNAQIMHVMRKGKYLWMRTIGSTLVGEGLDSLVFVAVAFLGTMPNAAVVTAIWTGWLFKTVYEAAATPVTYLIVNHIKSLPEGD